MQLTELLFQKVQGLGPQGHVALRPGYVALQCASPSLRHALVAAIFPGPDDDRRLSDGTGPARVGVGLLPAPGAAPHRLLRELGAERQLQRQDDARKFQPLSKDPLEVETFLALACGFCPAEAYANVFVLDRAELPSERGKPAPVDASIDQKKVAELKQELETTRRYEEAQDELFKAAVQHRELEEVLETAHKAEAALREIEDKQGKTGYSPQEKAELVARCKRLRADEGKRDEELRNIANQRARLRDSQGSRPEPFYKNTMFSGGLVAGVAIDLFAVALKRPPIAFLGLVAFGFALYAALQWIASDEEQALASVRLKELKDREDRVKKAFLEEQAPLRAALAKAKLTDPDDLIQLFEEMADVDRKREAAAARVRQLRDDPRLENAEHRLAELGEKRQALEAQVSQQGFARPLNQIEADLKQALGIAASAPKKAALPEADVPKLLFARAAEVLATPPEQLAQAVEPRLAAYLTALTDKRVVAGRMDGNGQLLLSTADGRWGAYHGMPPPLRDLVYVALRLALLERVTQQKKLPVVIDDAFAPLDARTQALLARMLKGLAAQTQVLHRCTELPPQGLADHLVKIP